MNHRHLRDTFLALVDGDAAPEHADTQCAGCNEARELRLAFEREFQAAMRSMAPQPLPPGMSQLGSRAVRRPLVPLVGAVAAVLLMVGIALAVPRSPSGDKPELSAAPIRHSNAEAPSTALDEWRARLPEAMRETTPFQVAIIHDGLVTQDEHERARDAFLKCMRDAGVVVGPTFDEFGLIEGLSLLSHDPNIRVDDVKQRCEQQFYSEVQLGWMALVTAGDSDAARLERWAACLIGRGYDVSPHPQNASEITRAVGLAPNTASDLGQCSDETRYP